MNSIHYKKQIITIKEALDKISNGEFVLVEDVLALLNNNFESLVFFEKQELKNRLRQNPNLFIDWITKQLILVEKEAKP